MLWEINKRRSLRGFLPALLICIGSFMLTGCKSEEKGQNVPSYEKEGMTDNQITEKNQEAANAVKFEHELDAYEPVKKEYNFYFTYKVVHPWWDAVAMGMEDAANQYEEKGIIVNYEYLAPEQASAQNQIKRLQDASRRKYDVIGVDVADVEKVHPASRGCTGFC